MANNQVFVDDLTAGTTTLVSVSTTGGSGNGASSLASISADGQFIAFVSTSTNLFALVEPNGGRQVYLRDLSAGSTTQLSIDAAGTGGANNGAGFSPLTLDSGMLMSADGSTVVFDSPATN